MRHCDLGRRRLGAIGVGSQIECRETVDDRLGALDLVNQAAAIGGRLRGVFDVRHQLPLAVERALRPGRNLQHEPPAAHRHVERLVPALYDRIFHSDQRMGGQGIEVDRIGVADPDRLIERHLLEAVISRLRRTRRLKALRE
ncbi:hypothetical protein E0504_19190 [Parafrankia sp. BMG5.11]|nr:hypothetical protein E0504_19190 [Parafrankia sp. BMG5.11]